MTRFRKMLEIPKTDSWKFFSLDSHCTFFVEPNRFPAENVWKIITVCQLYNALTSQLLRCTRCEQGNYNGEKHFLVTSCLLLQVFPPNTLNQYKVLTSTGLSSSNRTDFQPKIFENTKIMMVCQLSNAFLSQLLWCIRW